MGWEGARLKALARTGEKWRGMGAEWRVTGAGVARIGDNWRKMAQIGAGLAQGRGRPDRRDVK
jgi:hypothetical protein